MKIKAICLGVMAAIMLMVVSVPLSDAGECEYGTVQAWARTLNDDGSWGEWQNATVHANLKVHEPFQVKVKVTAKVNCKHVYVSLERAGTIIAYEVVNGPSDIMEYIRNTDISAGWSKTYQWVIRPTNNWTEGTAALNIGSYFYNAGETKTVDFTIIAAYISSEEWQGNGGNGNNSSGGGGGGGIPGFESTLMITSLIVAMGVISVLKRRKR